MQLSLNSAGTLASSAVNSIRSVLVALVSPFRNSIWTRTDKYHFGSCTDQEFDAIAKIYELWAAKLNIAFPSLDVCRKLAAEAATFIEQSSTADQGQMIVHLKQYLDRAVLLPGVGIITAICLLAIWSDGRFAPIDWKVASGMRKLGILSAKDEKTLSGKSHALIAHIYVIKVLSAWTEETKWRTPKEVDDYWGSLATPRTKK
jgi:hypothetical protein